MIKLKKFATACGASTMSFLLLSGCADSVAGVDLPRIEFGPPPPAFGEETRKAWCEAMLGVDLTAGPGDNPETVEGVADMVEVVWLLCREYIEIPE